MPDISSPQEILFTRQRHEADRAGLHWDYRLVHGDKAYSWATKKELPEPGKSILLFEQPVHTSHYALSERVEIPKGSYGAGTTTLDFVRKAKLIPDEAEPGKLVIETGDGEKFLLKQLPQGKYGDKAWLFKNLTKNPNMKKQAKLEQLENGLFYDDKTGRAEVSQAYHDAVYKKQVHPQALRHLAKGTAAFAGVGALTGGIAGRSLRGAAILGGVGGLAGLAMAHFGNKQQKSFRTQEALRDHIETDLYDEDYFGSPRRVKGPVHIQKSAAMTNKYLTKIASPETMPALQSYAANTHRLYGEHLNKHLRGINAAHQNSTHEEYADAVDKAMRGDHEFKKAHREQVDLLSSVFKKHGSTFNGQVPSPDTEWDVLHKMKRQQLISDMKEIYG